MKKCVLLMLSILINSVLYTMEQKGSAAKNVQISTILHQFLPGKAIPIVRDYSMPELWKTIYTSACVHKLQINSNKNDICVFHSNGFVRYPLSEQADEQDKKVPCILYSDQYGRAVSPDGSQVVTKSAKDDHQPGQLYVYNFGKPRQDLDSSYAGYDCAVSSSGKYLGAYVRCKIKNRKQKDGLAIFDLANGKCLRFKAITVGSTGAPSITFSHDEKTLACPDWQNRIYLFNHEKNELHALKGHCGLLSISDLDFSNNDEYLLSSGDCSVLLWSCASRKLIHRYAHSASVSSARFGSSSSMWIATTDGNGDMRLIDRESGEVLYKLPNDYRSWFMQGWSGLSVSQDGSMLAVRDDERVKVFINPVEYLEREAHVLQK